MLSNLQAGCSEENDSKKQELEFLYKRLATIDNLIHSLEQYDQYRKASAPLGTEKTP